MQDFNPALLFILNDASTVLAGPVGTWILSLGVWNDNGVWDDNANWID